MSKMERNLILAAPSHYCGEEPTERLVSRGLCCGYCQGNGYFWGLDEFGESVKEPCPVCGGSCELDAEVTIVWKRKAAVAPQHAVQKKGGEL